jgi:ABC-type uncharacterized transport system substrate-binding protein
MSRYNKTVFKSNKIFDKLEVKKPIINSIFLSGKQMKRIIYITVMSLLFLTTTLFSHPHVKITARTEFIFHGEKCEGIQIEWKFDDYFSGSLIHQFDLNRDKSFDENEIQNLYKNAFSNLKNYGYFVFIRKDNIRKNPERITDFKAWQKNGTVFYSFYIPFDKMKYENDFYLAVFDRSFYCSVVYDKNPVIIRQKEGVSPSFKIVRNKKYPVYYNPQGDVDDTTLYKKWRPGLETAYPDEIHILFNR